MIRVFRFDLEVQSDWFTLSYTDSPLCHKKTDRDQQEDMIMLTTHCEYVNGTRGQAIGLHCDRGGSKIEIDITFEWAHRLVTHDFESRERGGDIHCLILAKDSPMNQHPDISWDFWSRFQRTIVFI